MKKISCLVLGLATAFSSIGCCCLGGGGCGGGGMCGPTYGASPCGPGGCPPNASMYAPTAYNGGVMQAGLAAPPTTAYYPQATMTAALEPLPTY